MGELGGTGVTPPTPVDRAELPGMEFDWLAADAVGELAQMLTSGIGKVPDAALISEELPFELHLHLDERPQREPLGIPEGSFDALLAAPQRRGLYVFKALESSWDAQGRAALYRRVAALAQPLLLGELPDHLRPVVARLDVRFSEVQTVEVLE